MEKALKAKEIFKIMYPNTTVGIGIGEDGSYFLSVRSNKAIYFPDNIRGVKVIVSPLYPIRAL